jgi:hypothetical protein
MLWIEIQHGKLPMRELPYQAELGATAACSRRLCETAAHSGVIYPSRQDESKPESFLGDSWFTSIPLCEWAADNGHAYFGALKTSTKGTPFQEVIDKMSDWPSGSNIVMECTSPNKSHQLICIGYKYSARKALVFLGTKNSGSTKPGEPYIARFPDANGNVAQRAVPRPDVISKYFNDSNVIDSHNQARQGVLQLEKCWVTQHAWFRLVTTLIGMTVTDCWRAYKHAMPNKKDKEMPIKDFADCIAYDCINNCHSSHAFVNGYLPAPDDSTLPRMVGGGVQDDVSTVTAPTATLTPAQAYAEAVASHPFRDNPEREQAGVGRPKRRVCKVENCGGKYHQMCFHPACMNHEYMTPHGTRAGVFYCKEHQHIHHERVLEGNGKV